MQEEMMVLVDEQDMPIGTMPKLPTHEQGLLHRAFSVFLFDSNGNMLLQQRASQKYHSPLLWTNACCSHPAQHEPIELAAARRMQQELGVEVPVKKAFSFIYKAELDNGLTEHEYDHVLVGECNHLPLQFNTNEVEAVCFKPMNEIAHELQSKPAHYTAWFKIAFPMIQEWLQNQLQ